MAQEGDCRVGVLMNGRRGKPTGFSKVFAVGYGLFFQGGERVPFKPAFSEKVSVKGTDQGCTLNIILRIRGQASTKRRSRQPLGTLNPGVEKALL
jgi:hypothetical protein